MKFLAFLLVFFAGSAFASDIGDTRSLFEFDQQLTKKKKGSYYDWGKANNGFGYCYKWASNGKVLNQGKPVANFYCENNKPFVFYLN